MPATHSAAILVKCLPKFQSNFGQSTFLSLHTFAYSLPHATEIPQMKNGYIGFEQQRKKLKLQRKKPTLPKFRRNGWPKHFMQSASPGNRSVLFVHTRARTLVNPTAESCLRPIRMVWALRALHRNGVWHIGQADGTQPSAMDNRGWIWLSYSKAWQIFTSPVAQRRCLATARHVC